MINNRQVIVLIPARGGSKGIHRKNLRKIGGKSLVEIAISTSLAAPSVDDVYLSSEDAEILEVGKSLGVNLVVRPDNLASDRATANEVVRSFIDYLPKSTISNDPYIVYIQPTSPFRTSLHIEDALNQLSNCNANTLVSVSELPKSPFKSFLLDEDGRLSALFDESWSNFSRQELPKTYIPNGAIYIFRVSDFNRRGGFPSNGSLPYVMADLSSIDIDSESDLELAKKIYGDQIDRI